MSYDMKFKSGRLAGTRLEIMPSKAATQLPDGTPLVPYNYDDAELNETQVNHRLGNVDVHARQGYSDMVNGEYYEFVGPSVAQQWRSEYQAYRTQRGWRARYYIGDPVEWLSGPEEDL